MFRLGLVLVVLGGTLLFSLPRLTQAEDGAIYNLEHLSRIAIIEAREAGAKEAAPYAYEQAVTYRRAAEGELMDVDPDTVKAFYERSLRLAEQAKAKAQVGSLVVDNGQFTIN